MTDTTDQLALTSAFMRPYIALARKHEYYKLVRTRMAAELAGAPPFLAMTSETNTPASSSTSRRQPCRTC